MTLPVFASTNTCSTLGLPLRSAPSTTDSYASLGVPQASTFNVAAEALSILASCALAVLAAAAALTEAVVPMLISADWATAVPLTVPAASVVTTTSPPTTGRPRYVRAYVTYCSPRVPAMTPVRLRASPAPLRRTDTEAALSIRRSADVAARAEGAGAGLGVSMGLADAGDAASVSAAPAAKANEALMRLVRRTLVLLCSTRVGRGGRGVSRVERRQADLRCDAMHRRRSTNQGKPLSMLRRGDPARRGATRVGYGSGRRACGTPGSASPRRS